MRVIAGELRGRRLHFRSTPDVRPDSEKVRGALFDILQDRIVGKEMLDLFCGSGSVGIEALSRGARRVDFVDIKPDLTVRNLHDLGISERARVFRRDALRALAIMHRKATDYDIVFVGAPYDLPEGHEVIRTIGRLGIVRGEGTLVYEHRKGAPDVMDPVGFVQGRLYLYGQTALRFYDVRK